MSLPNFIFQLHRYHTIPYPQIQYTQSINQSINEIEVVCLHQYLARYAFLQHLSFPIHERKGNRHTDGRTDLDGRNNNTHITALQYSPTNESTRLDSAADWTDSLLNGPRNARRHSILFYSIRFYSIPFTSFANC